MVASVSQRRCLHRSTARRTAAPTGPTPDWQDEARGWDDQQDPWDSQLFDEAFVRDAKVREDDVATRAARSEELRRRLEQEDRSARRAGRRQRWSGNTRKTFVLGCLVAAFGALWLACDRGLITAAGGDLTTGRGSLTILGDARPTASGPDADEPLGVPPYVPDADSYQFMQTQRGGEPVAYDPCRRISVVINLDNAPPGGEAVVRSALDQVSSATGLVFELEGATDEPIRPERPAFQSDRYGDRWAPVLIAWSDAVDMPELDGVAGIGGSTSVTPLGEQEAVYVTGTVALRASVFDNLLLGVGGAQIAEGLVLHELGHLVGLAHVDDQSQLMHGEGHPGIVGFADGDRAGLAELGRGSCFTQL
jgi:hypothetical protein